MNPEVRKLLEQTAEQLYKYDCIAKGKPTGGYDEEIMPMHIAFNCRARDVLSLNPDLALIKRGEELPMIPDSPEYSDKPYTDIEKQAFRAGALTYRNTVSQKGYLPAIPLAEELKEDSND